MNTDKMLKEQITQLIAQRNNLHQEDPRIAAIYDKICESLKGDLNSTISFLDTIDSKTLLDISSVFGPVSYYFQSKLFIAKLEELLIRFKDIELYHLLLMDVQDARNALV